MKIAAVIVAAGYASRFDAGQKLLADFNGLPLIRHAATAVSDAKVADAVLVVGPDGDDVVAAAGDGPWRIVINSDPSAGLSSSIRAGVAALDATIDGALIVLGDMPFVTTATISQLCATFSASDGQRIVFPVTVDGRQSNPVLWPRALLPALLQITGDSGGKALLADNAHRLAPVTIDDEAASLDIDTKDDLARAMNLRR